NQEKVREKWQAVDEQTKNCLENLTEHSIKEIWSASFPNGFTMALPLWQLLFHVANHGTHTRAQIIAAIRRLGHNPGIYEFFRFALEQGI
ncbi:MAG: DinB family protein, partial [Candidatus Hodarchaeales archaeon]